MSDDKLSELTKLAQELGFLLVPQGSGVGQGYLDEAIKRDAEETREAADYKATWERRWKAICTNHDGTFNLDAIQRELSDYSMIMSFYSRVLEHVTGGRVSYLTTWPSVVCSVVDERINELVAEETEELRKEVERLEAFDLSDTEAISDTLLLVGHDIPIGVIPEWTDEQKTQAIEWAQATHFQASDNDVHVPPYPEFLAPYQNDGPDLTMFNEKEKK